MKDHEVADYVTVYHRDVCENGFGMTEAADAVFLDLPSPWRALTSAKEALKREGGRICSFSPCIEQVQKTVAEMTKLGFTDIYTVESLRRVLCVKKYEMPDFNFDMDSIKVKKIDEDAGGGVTEEKIDEQPAKKRSRTNGGDDEDDEDDDEENGDDGGSSKYAAKPINQQPGHTSFLTFATLLHKDFLN